MVIGEITAGWRLVEHALAEYLSRQVVMIWTLAALHRMPPL